jgi:hypothetical protein
MLENIVFFFGWIYHDWYQIQEWKGWLDIVQSLWPVDAACNTIVTVLA